MSITAIFDDFDDFCSVKVKAGTSDCREPLKAFLLVLLVFRAEKLMLMTQTHRGTAKKEQNSTYNSKLL